MPPGKIHEIYAPLDGTAAQFYCEDGDKVSENDPIMEIECMKINNRIESPVSGTVYIKCALGEIVSPDTLIAVVVED